MLVLEERGLDRKPVEDFDDLVDLFDRWPNTRLVMLSAYLDASERNSGVFSVAGFAFGPDSLKKAEREWRSLLNGRQFHMTDLHARSKQFGDLSSAQSFELYRRLVNTLKNRAAYAGSISIDIATARKYLPQTSTPDYAATLLGGLRTPYAACLYFAMRAMAMKMQDRHGEGVVYFIEAGDKHQAEATKFLDFCLTAPPLRDSLLLRAYSVVSKGDYVMLGCADALAWEWARHVDRVREGKPMRPSLRAMLQIDPHVRDDSLGYDGDRFRVSHFGEELLAKHGPRFSHLLQAQTPEEVSQALRQIGIDPPLQAL